MLTTSILLVLLQGAYAQYYCECTAKGATYYDYDLGPMCTLASQSPLHSFEIQCPYDPATDFADPWDKTDTGISIDNGKWLCNFPQSCLAQAGKAELKSEAIAAAWKPSSTGTLQLSAPPNTGLPLDNVLQAVFSTNSVSLSGVTVTADEQQALVTVQGQAEVMGTTTSVKVVAQLKQTPACSTQSIDVTLKIPKVDKILSGLLGPLIGNLVPQAILGSLDVPASDVSVTANSCYPQELRVTVGATTTLFQKYRVQATAQLKTSFVKKGTGTNSQTSSNAQSGQSLQVLQGITGNSELGPTTFFFAVEMPDKFTLSMLASALQPLDVVALQSVVAVVSSYSGTVVVASGNSYEVRSGLNLEAILSLTNAEPFKTVGNLLQVRELAVSAQIASLTDVMLKAKAKDFILKITDRVWLKDPAVFVQYLAPKLRVGMELVLHLKLTDLKQDQLDFRGRLFVQVDPTGVGLGMGATLLTPWKHPLGITYGDMTIIKPTVTLAAGTVGNSVILKFLQVAGTIQLGKFQMGGLVQYEISSPPVIIGEINGMDLNKLYTLLVTDIDSRLALPAAVVPLVGAITWENGTLGINGSPNTVTLNNKEFPTGFTAYLTGIKLAYKKYIQLSGSAELFLSTGVGISVSGSVDPFKLGPLEFGGYKCKGSGATDPNNSFAVKLMKTSLPSVSLSGCMQLFPYSFNAHTTISVTQFAAKVSVQTANIVNFNLNVSASLSPPTTTTNSNGQGRTTGATAPQVSFAGSFNSEVITYLEAAIPKIVLEEAKKKQQEVLAAQKTLKDKEAAQAAAKKKLDDAINAIVGEANAVLSAAEKKLTELEASISGIKKDLKDNQKEQDSLNCKWSNPKDCAKEKLLEAEEVTLKAKLLAAEKLLPPAQAAVKGAQKGVDAAKNVATAQTVVAAKAALIAADAAVVAAQTSLKALIASTDLATKLATEFGNYRGKLLVIDTLYIKATTSGTKLPGLATYWSGKVAGKATPTVPFTIDSFEPHDLALAMIPGM